MEYEKEAMQLKAGFPCLIRREVRTLFYLIYMYGYSGFNSSIKLLKSVHILKESRAERGTKGEVVGRSERTTNPTRVVLSKEPSSTRAG